MKVRDKCDDHNEILNFRIYKKLDDLKIESAEFRNSKRIVGLDLDVGR